MLFVAFGLGILVGFCLATFRMDFITSLMKDSVTSFEEELEDEHGSWAD